MLGEELRQLREERGLSLREMATRCRMSTEGISGIERGKRYPSLQTLERRAECLNVKIVVSPDETHIEPNGV